MVEHLKLVLDVIDRQGLSLARPPLPAALVGRGAGHVAPECSSSATLPGGRLRQRGDVTVMRRPHH